MNTRAVDAGMTAAASVKHWTTRLDASLNNVISCTMSPDEYKFQLHTNHIVSVSHSHQQLTVQQHTTNCQTTSQVSDMWQAIRQMPEIVTSDIKRQIVTQNVHKLSVDVNPTRHRLITRLINVTIKVVMQLCPGGNWTHDLLITKVCAGSDSQHSKVIKSDCFAV